jgi:hypothetical protein
VLDGGFLISYRVSHCAEVSPMARSATNAGVENLAVAGGDDSNISFESAAYAWAKNVDNSKYLNDGFRLTGAFRVQLEGAVSG